MYISANTVERIKFQAKKINIAIGDMLKELSLNKNTLSSMTTRGSWIQADSLAMIADYLNVSVDYLLCRTNFPEVITSEEQITALTLDETEIIKSYRSHPELQEAVNRILLPNKASEVKLQIQTKKEAPKLAAYGGDFEAPKGKKPKLT